MGLLFRYGGLKGVEIAQIMDLDYSTVSKERKRLREWLVKGARLRRQFKRIERELSKVNPVRGHTCSIAHLKKRNITLDPSSCFCTRHSDKVKMTPVKVLQRY